MKADNIGVVIFGTFMATCGFIGLLLGRGSLAGLVFIAIGVAIICYEMKNGDGSG